MAEIITTTEVPSVTSTPNKAVDFGKALSWYLNDPKFGKTLLIVSLWILSCFLILPIFYVVPVIMGFYIELVKNIQNGRWEIPEFGSSEQWNEGVKFFLISLLFGVAVGAIFVALMIPLGFLINAVEEFAIVVPFLVIFGMIAHIVLGAVLTYTPIMIIAKTGNYSLIWNVYLHTAIVKAEWKNMLLGFLVMMVASYALSFIGALACYIGIFPAIIVTYLMMAGVIGQIDTTEISKVANQ